MRMRRKHNLDERLEQVKDYILERTIEDRNMKTSVEIKDYLDYRIIFGNDNPVELEIGCGKGRFINEMAKRHPDTNFIAIEMLSNVIVDACEKAKKENLKNLKFMILRAECLPSYIPEHSLRRIYINFPTPLPQKGYEKQRLTNRKFLSMYKTLLAKGGDIYHKTDNRGMFEFSVCEFSQSGFGLKDVTLDLLNSPLAENNIMTEHEKKYSDMLMPIYKLTAFVLDDKAE